MKMLIEIEFACVFIRGKCTYIYIVYNVKRESCSNKEIIYARTYIIEGKTLAGRPTTD